MYDQPVFVYGSANDAVGAAFAFAQGGKLGNIFFTEADDVAFLGFIAPDFHG